MKDTYLRHALRCLLLGLLLSFAGLLSAQTTTPLTPQTPAYLCSSGFIKFNAFGGDGTPITYTATGVDLTSPDGNTGVVQPRYRSDPNAGPIMIEATQSGKTISYTFSVLTYCNDNTISFRPVLRKPIPDVTLALGQVSPTLNVGQYFRSVDNGYDYRGSFRYEVYNVPPGMTANTRSGVPPGTSAGDTATAYIGGTPTVAGVYAVAVVATKQPGGFSLPSRSIADTFNITVQALANNPLELTASYDCATGNVTFRPKEGTGNGGTITYSSDDLTDIQVFPLSNTIPVPAGGYGKIKPELLANPRPITIRASQPNSSYVASYTFNFIEPCIPRQLSALPDLVYTISPNDGVYYNLNNYFAEPVQVARPYAPRYDVKGLPAGLSVNTFYGSGQQTFVNITGQPTVTGVFPVTVTVSDTKALGSPAISATFTITIKPAEGTGNPGTPTDPGSTTGNLAVAKAIPDQSGTLNQPYRFSVPAGTFSGPVSRIDVSDLPRGLMYLADSYTIMGTVSGADQRYITVTAFDAQGNRVQTTFLLVFSNGTGNPGGGDPGNPGGGGTTGSLAVAKAIPNQSSPINQPFRFSIPAGTFSGPVSRIDVSDLPRGLMYLSDSYTIMGTVGGADQRYITVTAFDAQGNRVQAGFLLSFTGGSGNPTTPVDPGTGNPGGGTSTGSLAVAQPIADQSGRVSQFFTFTIPAGTFSGPVTHVDVSDLPRGLMYLSDTRTIRGTVDQPDQRTLTVTAQDGSGNSVKTTFQLTFSIGRARLGAQAGEVQLSAQLYPNPVQQELVVRITNAQDQEVQLAITDLRGRIIDRRSVRVTTPVHDERMPVPSLASGLYLLKVNTASQAITLKMSKQ